MASGVGTDEERKAADAVARSTRGQCVNVPAMASNRLTAKGDVGVRDAVVVCRLEWPNDGVSPLSVAVRTPP